MSVNRGSHFQVRFVWQVWDGQLSPAFKSIRLKAFGGWKVDWVTTQLHARILRGKGVQKKKPDKFTDGNSTSPTFCPTSVYIRAQTHIHIIPYTYTIYASVYHAYASTHVYIYIYIYHTHFFHLIQDPGHYYLVLTGKERFKSTDIHLLMENQGIPLSRRIVVCTLTK